jgi:hypothetical protein
MHSNTLKAIKVSVLALAFAILGAVSVGYVAAQTASSTEPVEPTVPEAPAVVEEPAVVEPDTTVGTSSPEAETNPEDTPPAEAEPEDPQEPEQASTTPEENTSSGGGTPPTDTGTSPPATEGEVLGASDTATTTPEEAAVPEPVIAPPGPDPLSMSTAISIAALQDAYFNEHESYLQILSGNHLPDYETGTVAEKLGQTIDPGTHVDVYENVYGKGYQIFFEEDGVTYSAGYGPEAQDRTFTYTLPVLVASSTSTEL